MVLFENNVDCEFSAIGHGIVKMLFDREYPGENKRV